MPAIWRRFGVNTTPEKTPAAVTIVGVSVIIFVVMIVQIFVIIIIPILVIIILQIFCLSDPPNGEMAQLFSSDPSDNKEMMLGGLPLGQDKVTSSLYISIPRMNCIHQSLENQHWQV